MDDLQDLIISQFPSLQTESIGESWKEVVHNVSKVTLPIHARYVRWTRPPVGGYKLNFDGALKDQFRAGRGGMLRDSNGRMFFAFTEFYRG